MLTLRRLFTANSQRKSAALALRSNMAKGKWKGLQLDKKLSRRMKLVVTTTTTGTTTATTTTTAAANTTATPSITTTTTTTPSSSMNAESLYNSAMKTISTANKSRDIRSLAQAVNLLNKAATHYSHAPSEFQLGLIYQYGTLVGGDVVVVARDLNRALKLYSKASEKGHAGAAYNLAWIYFKGMSSSTISNQNTTGTSGSSSSTKFVLNRDLEEAVRLFRLASDQGYELAHYHLANIYFTGLPALSTTSSQSNSSSTTASSSSSAPSFIVERNVKEAARLYKKAWETFTSFSPAASSTQSNSSQLAAKRRILDALYKLALIYHEGGMSNKFSSSATSSVPSQNSFEEKALKLYKQAASLGHAKSAVKLGIIYFNGLAGGGKGKDMAKDMKAGSGNKNSSSSSSSNEVTCTGSLQYVKAARLFKIAADLRDAHGRFLLAKMYQSGQGVPNKNISKAKNLLKLAAEQGHRQAQLHLAMMLEDGIIQSSSGSGVASDGDLKEAKRLYTLAVGDRDYSLPPQQQQQQQRPHYHHDLHQDQSNLFIPLAMYCEGAFRLGRMIELEQTSCVLLDKKEVGVGMEEKGNEKVLRLYSLAVDKGRHPDAAFRLAQLYQQNHQLVSSKTANIANTSSSSSPLPDFDPYQLYLLAAEQGHCEAQFCLGEMFEYGNRYDGTGGNSNNNIKINTASLFDVDLEKAIRYYKQASNQGHAESQYRLGFMYHLNGRCIIEHNIETAIHYYKLAALQGHVESQYQLGRIFEQQQFVTGISTTNTDSTTDSPTSSSSSTDNDQHRRRYLDQAIDFYKLASMQGHGEAQLRLARIFKLGVKGIDVDKSKELALRYSRLAADNGISIFNADEMEDMLSEEEGMDIRCFSDADATSSSIYATSATTTTITTTSSSNQPDQSIAVQYRKSHKMYVLAMKIFTKNDTNPESVLKAASLFRMAVDKGGHPLAQYQLAQIYQNGLLGAAAKKTDLQEAVKLYTLSAEKGCAQAQYSLGILHERGLGVVMDIKEAARLYRLAADSGFIQAQLQLARIYETQDLMDGGDGGGTNSNAASLKEAVRLYKLSSDLDNNAAHCKLGYLYARGVVDGTPNYEEAARLYKLAADNGFSKGQSLLAQMHLSGKLKNSDLELALKLLLKSAKNGNYDSLRALGYMYEHGLGVKQDAAKAVSYFEEAANHGNASAMYSLGHMYSKGKGVTQNSAEALRFWKMAAQKGHAAAQYKLMEFPLDIDDDMQSYFKVK